MQNDEIRTILKDLPVTIKGLCYHDDDGTPVIVLNSRLPREIQQLTFQHEMDHILRGEMYDITYIEYGA